MPTGYCTYCPAGLKILCVMTPCAVLRCPGRRKPSHMATARTAKMAAKVKRISLLRAIDFTNLAEDLQSFSRELPHLSALSEILLPLLVPPLGRETEAASTPRNMPSAD